MPRALTGWHAMDSAREKVNALADDVNGQIDALGSARESDWDAYRRARAEYHDLVALYDDAAGLLTPHTDAEYIEQWRAANP
jgi:hypothetical protein